MFADANAFDPDRFQRGEADNPFAWVPFGGGKNKCAGNAFGLLQLKAIVAVLLKHRDFELIDAPQTYRDNYNRATVMPHGPVRIWHRRRIREARVFAVNGAHDVHRPKPASRPADSRMAALDPNKAVTIKIDLGLCQGHSVCVSEAPEVFRISDRGDVEVLMDNPGPDTYAALVKAAEHCPNQVITLTQP